MDNNTTIILLNEPSQSSFSPNFEIWLVIGTVLSILTFCCLIHYYTKNKLTVLTQHKKPKRIYKFDFNQTYNSCKPTKPFNELTIYQSPHVLTDGHVLIPVDEIIGENLYEHKENKY